MSSAADSVQFQFKFQGWSRAAIRATPGSLFAHPFGTWPCVSLPPCRTPRASSSAPLGARATSRHRRHVKRPGGAEACHAAPLPSMPTLYLNQRRRQLLSPIANSNRPTLICKDYSALRLCVPPCKPLSGRFVECRSREKLPTPEVETGVFNEKHNGHSRVGPGAEIRVHIHRGHNWFILQAMVCVHPRAGSDRHSISHFRGVPPSRSLTLHSLNKLAGRGGKRKDFLVLRVGLR